MQILLALLALSFLVFIHELGHYLAARWAGVRVEEFSVGFPPKILKRKYGETEYALSLLPLGGYVRLFGQSTDDADPSNPRNYAAKSIWQRFVILIAGPAMNIAFACLALPLAFMSGSSQPAYLAQPPQLAALDEQGLAFQAGFRAGDRIVRINGEEIASWNAYEVAFLRAYTAGEIRIDVQRAYGDEASITLLKDNFSLQQGLGWSPYIPPIIGHIRAGSPAESAGLQPQDRILAINETQIETFQQIPPALNAIGDNRIAVGFERAGEKLSVELRPQFNPQSQNWQIGFGLPVVQTRLSFVEAFFAGFERMWVLTESIFAFLKNLVTAEVRAEEVGGPIMIVNAIGSASQQGLSNFLTLLGFISFQLAILNLLPIPALDGGHILLLGVEKLRGAPLPKKMQRNVQIFGAVVLIVLMVYVTTKDILSL